MRTPPKRPAAAAPTGGAGSGRAEPDPRRQLGVGRRVALMMPDLWRLLGGLRAPRLSPASLLALRAG
ncbi:MAG: hypothetical protein ABIP08_10995 [Lautropia sp.]